MGPEGIDIIWMQLQAQPRLQMKPRHPAGSQPKQSLCFLESPFDKRLNSGIHRLKIVESVHRNAWIVSRNRPDLFRASTTKSLLPMVVLDNLNECVSRFVFP